ncbi:MAG: hypothetical protein JEZ03_12320 [Bacteroidales bacterium]|nr:hypothetical protein [Bacteroidales bacterium]
MYSTVINIHIIVSTLFTIVGLIIVIKSFQGWILKKSYTKFDNLSSLIFLSLLYIQLILGVLMYFFMGSSDHTGSMSESVDTSILRFWVIEHFSFMIFALFLSQLGRLFIVNNLTGTRKHKNTVFYYGISFILIMISAGMGMMR